MQFDLATDIRMASLISLLEQTMGLGFLNRVGSVSTLVGGVQYLNLL